MEGNSILKIYASTTDKIGLDLLYEYIVSLAKQRGISGSTVTRGIMGFGPSSTHIDTARFWELTEKLPVTIEIVDRTEVLMAFYKEIESDLATLPKGCLVTMQAVDILFQKSGVIK